MNNTLDLSLIISVYNREEVLRLVLAAVQRQTFKKYEVIIADDGSGPAVKDVVDEARAEYGLSITHLWQEDIGWRKNRILNSAIRAAGSPYLVFIDGDCLPGKDFLRDHFGEREDGKVLLGRRVEMSKRWAEKLTLVRVMSGRFERIGILELFDGAMGKALRIEDGIRIASPSVRELIRRKSMTILGSNFSLHKKDLVAINGFDETYEAPGLGEDSDIQYRLSLIGVTGKSLRNLAVQYHVYHPRTKPSENSVRRFEEVRSIGDPICRVGLEHFDKGKPTGSN